MAQFDVYKLRPANKRTPFVIDVQSETLAPLATRFVVPLRAHDRAKFKPIARLNPLVSIEGTTYIAVFQELAAVPLSILTEYVTSAARDRGALVAAVDLVFTGI